MRKEVINRESGYQYVGLSRWLVIKQTGVQGQQDRQTEKATRAGGLSWIEYAKKFEKSIVFYHLR
jgi:hypothetical protein